LSAVHELIPPAGPIRTLCVSHLARSSATGILMAVAVLYFTRTVHLPAAEVGLALSVGAGCGLLTAVPAGRLADALGPRNTTVVLLCLLGLFVSGYPLVGDFVGLLVVSALVLATESATDAAVGALLAGLIPPPERVRAMSYMRAAANLSMALGAAASGIGLYLDTHAAYLVLLLSAGGLFVAAGLTYLRVPRVAPVPHTGEGALWPVLRDAPYATVCLLNAVLFVNSGVLLVALPIWIAERTSAPTWLFPVVVVMNATVVVLFQTRSSRSSAELAGGARAMRLGGLLLAACCPLFALATGQPTWLAVVLLLAGGLVHVAGEMFHAAGSWSLGFGLAPEHAQGQYQGVFAMSTQLGQLIAPLVATVLLIGLGIPGWLALAALFAVAGAFAPAAGRWAQRTRRPAPTGSTNAAVVADAREGW
jgi:MFS family permease